MKRSNSISTNQKINAIIVIVFMILLFLIPGIAFLTIANPVGIFFIFMAMLFIILVFWRQISHSFNNYKLRTNDSDVYKIKKAIESFKQSRNWPNESGYQAELYNFLKKEFPYSRLEEAQGASRPDIVIKDIAIEIKGPTTNEGINTLPSKCIKYSQHYRRLIFVLFSPKYSESNFQEIKTGIKRTFPNFTIFIIKNKV